MKTTAPISFEDLQKQSYTIVDIRPTEEFTEGFIPGSIHIPLSKLRDRAAALLDKDKPVVLVGDPRQVNDAADILEENKFAVAGHFEGGIQQWKTKGKELDMIIMIEPDEYAMDEPFDNKILLLDVRQAEDYAALHAEKAVSMPLATFSDVIHIASVDDDQNVYIHCGGGSSAITAATLFKKQGFHSIRVIAGGLDAMKAEPRIKMVEEKKAGDAKENRSQDSEND